jgi:hypothetical protein
MNLDFAEFFLNEAPLGAPAALPPAPGGMGAPPPLGGAMGGGMPPPPMGGGMGMPPPPPMGGMGGPPMPGQPGQQQGPKELKQTDVWGVLEELLGIDKKTSNKSKNNVDSSNKNHLMS